MGKIFNLLCNLVSLFSHVPFEMESQVTLTFYFLFWLLIVSSFVISESFTSQTSSFLSGKCRGCRLCSFVVEQLTKIFRYEYVELLWIYKYESIFWFFKILALQKKFPFCPLGCFGKILNCR